MSYGVFNWWWGEDDGFLKWWDTLTILSLSLPKIGSYAYLDNELNPDKRDAGRNSSYIYDSRLCSLNSDSATIHREYGATEWNWLVKNHPNVAKNLLKQPFLIYTGEVLDIYYPDVLGLTEKEFRRHFVYWDNVGWWILKDPQLNRHVGRILKINSPNFYNKFALESKGMIP